ncbi:hypothetical protein G7Y79_00021g050960 [Physcia stellaris]|nr:hypothetical protein G7Y79_00021g050960 [Physcia stellaris]
MAANLLTRQAPAGGPAMPLSPPYPVNTAGLGGLPTVDLDVPICTVFLLLFILGAISHMFLFKTNMKRGHKFLMSGMLFGFCMARIMSCILRIVWATRQHNIRLAIAAQVFVAAGVVLLFIINLIFAQRIIRAAHPNSGWHPAFAAFFYGIYALIVVSLIMLITSVVQSFYTLNSNTRRIDRDILLYGQTVFTVIGFLPIPLVIGGLIIPRKTRVEKFGSGRFRTKIAILLTSTTLLCLGAAFRAGTNYLTPRPATNPAWYHSKACFYLFNFTVEIIVILLYVVVRVDQRFWVPNGARAAGDYSRKAADEKDATELRIMPEEEVFDDVPQEEVASHADTKPADEEQGKVAAGT